MSKVDTTPASTIIVPTIGRMVKYTITAADAKAINKRREAGTDSESPGAQIHVGNIAEAGQVFPMMITRTQGDEWDSLVNGQVYLDGNDVHWITDAGYGSTNGHFMYY